MSLGRPHTSLRVSVQQGVYEYLGTIKISKCERVSRPVGRAACPSLSYKVTDVSPESCATPVCSLGRWGGGRCALMS